MEQGVRVGPSDQRQRRVGANHIVELVVVDVERLGFQRLGIESRRDEKLEYVNTPTFFSSSSLSYAMIRGL